MAAAAAPAHLAAARTQALVVLVMLLSRGFPFHGPDEAASVPTSSSVQLPMPTSVAVRVLRPAMLADPWHLGNATAHASIKAAESHVR